jgi:hypothetical protein
MTPSAEPSTTGPLPRVGELLVGAGFVSAEALQSGLARQRLENRKLGELIVELGMLDEADLDAVLAIQNDLRAGRAEELAALVNSRLGAILVGSQCVSQAQLEGALLRLENSEEQLGEILVRQDVLSRAQLNGALVFQRQVHARRSERFKLGQMLVESGDISEQSLREAIVRQEITGKRLGETLLESGAISKSALGAGLARQRRLIAAAMAAISFVMAGGMPADVAAATAKLQVSARVLTHVSFRAVKTPAQVSITPADVAQGYVDLEQPIEMEVRTNSSAGILIGITLNSPAFEGAVVSGPSGTMRITSGAPTLVLARHGQGMRTESVSLRLRIELARDAAPGVIAMPVTLFLSPA